MEFLVGTDHSIEKKIEEAERLFELSGQRVLCDKGLSAMLAHYASSIEANWEVMERNSVVKICTSCAVEDGGSCCGQGIEKNFDAVLLFINLLLGVRLPKSPEDETGCWFLGERGCKLKARHTICVNYLCPRLKREVSREGLLEVQSAMAKEVELGFRLEEAIKSLLKGM